MKTLLSIASLCLFASSASIQAATLIFSESFSTTTLGTNSYVGGWFGATTAFKAWNGASESSITTGELRVAPTGTTRAAGIILSNSDFTASGAGNYTLSFDVTAYNGGDPANRGLVTIWAGSGYAASTGDALFLNVQSAALEARGSATVSLLGSSTFSTSAVGDRQSISFNYDGTSDVALFFGANGPSWPFPTVSYDNIELTKDSLVPIPEPSVTALAAGVVGMMCLLRRRGSRTNG